MATRPWPPVDSLRFACEGVTAKNVNWANIFWATTSISGSANQADLAVVAQNVFGVYQSELLPLLGNDLTFSRVVANYYGASPLQIVADYVSSEMGGSANPTEVDSLAACISWTIPVTWRGGKPRTYLPGLPSEAFQDSNTLASDFITALGAAATAFRSGISGTGHGAFTSPTLGVASFFSGNAPRAVAQFYGYDGHNVHPRIDSMRRRLGKETT